MCEQYGVKLLRLPPYHCHLNPIELFWAHLKELLREALSAKDKLAAVEAKCYEMFDIAAKHCANDCKYVIRLEEKHAIDEGIEATPQAALAPQIATVNIPFETSDDEEEEEEGEEGDEYDDGIF